MLEPMPLPDLEYATTSVPTTADFQAIVEVLAGVPGCESRPNQLGNMQGVYRINRDDAGNYTLTYPAGADANSVQAVVNMYTP